MVYDAVSSTNINNCRRPFPGDDCASRTLGQERADFLCYGRTVWRASSRLELLIRPLWTAIEPVRASLVAGINRRKSTTTSTQGWDSDASVIWGCVIPSRGATSFRRAHVVPLDVSIFPMRSRFYLLLHLSILAPHKFGRSRVKELRTRWRPVVWNAFCASTLQTALEVV